MSDLRTMLERGDPIRKEGDMAPGDASRMRQAILSVRVGPGRATGRAMTAALAAGLFLAVAASGWFVRPDSEQADPRVRVVPLRQLQISAPGGTRVIWIFNPGLDVR